MASTGPPTTAFDEGIFGRYRVNSTVTTSTQTLKIDPNSYYHQVTVMPYGTSTDVVNDYPSSGYIEVFYRPEGSTGYIKMSDTINLTSGANTKLFTGCYDALRFDTTKPDSTHVGFKIYYRGWEK